MASREGRSEADEHAGETARLTPGASRDRVFPRSAVPRPSSSTSSEVMSSTPRTPSRVSTPGNPDDSMLSPRQPGQRGSPGNASRRDSVMALGSISHLQRHYAKEGLGAKEQPRKGGSLRLALGPAALSSLSKASSIALRDAMLARNDDADGGGFFEEECHPVDVTRSTWRGQLVQDLPRPAEVSIAELKTAVAANLKRCSLVWQLPLPQKLAAVSISTALDGESEDSKLTSTSSITLVDSTRELVKAVRRLLFVAPTAEEHEDQNTDQIEEGHRIPQSGTFGRTIRRRASAQVLLPPPSAIKAKDTFRRKSSFTCIPRSASSANLSQAKPAVPPLSPEEQPFQIGRRRDVRPAGLLRQNSSSSSEPRQWDRDRNRLQDASEMGDADNSSASIEQGTFDGLVFLRPITLKVLEMLQVLATEEPEWLKTKSGHTILTTEDSREQQVMQQYFNLLSEVLDRTSVFAEPIQSARTVKMAACRHRRKADQHEESMRKELMRVHRMPSWARTDIQKPPTSRLHEMLQFMLPALAQEDIDRTELLSALGDGQILCLAFNAAVRRSTQQWGYIALEHIHDVRHLGAYDQLQLHSHSLLPQLSHQDASSSVSTASAATESNSMLSEGPPTPGRQVSAGFRPAWTFRRKENLQRFHAAVMLRYGLKWTTTTATTTTTTPKKMVLMNSGRENGTVAPAAFDAARVARRAEGDAHVWMNMLETLVLAWMDKVIQEEQELVR